LAPYLRHKPSSSTVIMASAVFFLDLKGKVSSRAVFCPWPLLTFATDPLGSELQRRYPYVSC
jgi:hypothetical protein